MGKTAVFTFARMNPPTLGHELLLSELVIQALEKKADPFLFLSHTEDSKKNPIPYGNKVKFVKELFKDKFPELHIYSGESCKNPREALSFLYNLDDYSEVIGVFGSDRVDDMYDLMTRGNGKEGLSSGFYLFNKLSVTSAGERDPEQDGVEGVSATKLREYALENDFESFKKGLPEADETLINNIFLTTQRGLERA